MELACSAIASQDRERVCSMELTRSAIAMPDLEPLHDGIRLQPDRYARTRANQGKGISLQPDRYPRTRANQDKGMNLQPGKRSYAIGNRHPRTEPNLDDGINPQCDRHPALEPNRHDGISLQPGKRSYAVRRSQTQDLNLMRGQ